MNRKQLVSSTISHCYIKHVAKYVLYRLIYHAITKLVSYAMALFTLKAVAPFTHKRSHSLKLKRSHSGCFTLINQISAETVMWLLLYGCICVINECTDNVTRW